MRSFFGIYSGQPSCFFLQQCFEKIIRCQLSDKNYTIEEIFYSVKNLEQAKFIIADFKQADDGIIDCEIFDITYEGHEFINKVRKDKVWNKVKDKVMSTGASVTLSVISKLTTDTILGFISNVTSP